ncbi:hypothetical protein [Fodinicola acaciae]|uniref:hypothetical protein n=1 Tax=Fodinicola acaciae TaxID=2681555 RepID=UPI0013CF6914|nr:hypothetical protein [Fodinicola acaciae]
MAEDGRKRARWLAAVLAFALATCGLAAAAPATAASSPDGDIGRQETLTRSETWIDEKVPYSQSAWHANRFGSYRQDCSGYVSMAWHLSSSMTTATLPSVMTTIAAADLRPGDALWRHDSSVQHIALFIAWADAGHTQPIVREEYDYGHIAEQRTWTNGLRGFTPKRYNRIFDTPAPISTTWTAAEPTGTLSFVARTTANHLIVGRQDAVGGTAFSTADLPLTTDIDGATTVVPTGSPAAALDIDGKLTAFSRTTTGGLFHAWQETPGSTVWHSTIIPTSVTLAGDPAVALDVSGKLCVFARTTDNRLFHAWQSTPGLGPWQSTIIAGTLDEGGTVAIAGDPATAQDPSGKLTVFARTSTGTIYHAWQQTPGVGPWHATQLDPGATVTGRPAVAMDGSGRLVFLARTGTGGLVTGWQSQPGLGPWLFGSVDGAQAAGDPAAARNADGKVGFLVRTPDGALTTGTQTTTGSGTYTLGAVSAAVVAGDPAATAISGGLATTARQSDGKMLVGWQGGGTWTTTAAGGEIA